jgi:ribosomal protein L12E/L44/L45/RPP1/RPP2
MATLRSFALVADIDSDMVGFAPGAAAAPAVPAVAAAAAAVAAAVTADAEEEEEEVVGEPPNGTDRAKHLNA